MVENETLTLIDAKVTSIPKKKVTKKITIKEISDAFYNMIKDLSDNNIYPLDFWEKITFGKSLTDSFSMSDPDTNLSRVIFK